MKFKSIVCLFLLSAVAVYGQTVIAKYAGEFMSIGIGGRALAMGGANAAIAQDVTAAYYNPAGLAQLNFPQISLMHDERYGKLVNYNYAGIALPYGKDMTLAVSAARLGIDGIPDTREALVNKVTGQVIYDINNPYARINPSLVTEFSNQDWVFYLSGAKRWEDNLYLGANVKIIRRKIAEYTATGLGIDLGALYKYDENLTLGATIQDATTSLVAWSTGRNELITPTAKVGAAYSLSVLGAVFTPALDLDLRFENRKFASMAHLGPISIDPHFGGEFNYRGVFAIRGGYNDVKQFTLGAGVKLPKLNIDYSFAKFSGSTVETLPETHRISIVLTLEEDRFKRK